MKTVLIFLRFILGFAAFYLFFVYVFPVILKILVPFLLVTFIFFAVYAFVWYLRLSVIASENNRQLRKSWDVKSWRVVPGRSPIRQKRSAEDVIDAEFKRVD